MIDLAPANIRHDAVGARVIAAAHDGYKRGNLLVNCGNSIIELFVGLTAIEEPFRHLAEILDGPGSHHKVHKRKPVLQIFLGALSRTACDNDFPSGLLHLPSLEAADL